MPINGIQIDIQPAIIIDSKLGTQVSFQYIYFAKASDQFSTISTPCSQFPCKNGGHCVAVNETVYNCLCALGWEGELIVKIF